MSIHTNLTPTQYRGNAERLRERVSGGMKRRREQEGYEEEERTLTVVTAPVDVDAAAVVTCELSEREAGGVGCKNSQHS